MYLEPHAGDCCACQVYGCQPTWKKYLKQLAGRHTGDKFDEVMQQLTQLTQQVWALQEGSGEGRSSNRCLLFFPVFR